MTTIGELERRHVLRSWTVQNKNTYEEIAGAKGCWFWNSDGKRYLDFSSQLVNTNIGHQHPKIIAAIKEPAEKLCFIAPFYASEPQARLAEPDPGIMGRISALLAEKGVYCYPRWNYLFIAPPLSINRDELEFGLNAIDECLGLADEAR